MVSPIFSWREPEFVAAYGSAQGTGSAIYAQRSPIERAILALLEPVALPNERAFLQKNTFAVQFHTFDWRLNDLTGGRVD